jgi:type IV secretory pathway VirB10-like protein
MKIKQAFGLPEHHITSFNPFTFSVGAVEGGGSDVPPTPSAVVPTPPAAGPPAPVAPEWPANTPVAEMTDAQALAYHRFHSRKHRTERDELAAWKKGNQARVDQFAALEAASKTDAERAIETARTEAGAAARIEGESAAAAKYVTPLVQSRFESVLAGRMTAAAVATLVSGLNVATFLGADGLPDTEKVTAYAATFSQAVTGATPASPVNLGAGRTAPVDSSPSGEDAYARRHKRPARPS